ncbi:MAG: hypothetical protein H0V80_03150 [Acidobacteria bacterium]|nr:hypothetical protein [Acidobacteriota bacterium]
MSAEAVGEILARALRERHFADLLRADPVQALRGYDLTPDERAAITGSVDGRGPAQLDDRPRSASRLV